MWHEGIIGNYFYEVKSYDIPSEYGIDGGRISKLHLADRISYTCVACYDRGWDKLPNRDDAWQAVNDLIARWN